MKKLSPTLLTITFGLALAPWANAKNINIDSLLRRMTVEEKIGQLTQLSADMSVTGPSVTENYKEEIRKGNVGSIFNAYTPRMTIELQRLATEETRLKIPLLLGFDVIHGHKTIFPIPLGESSSWDLDLIESSARIAAREAAADGIHWAFAPMVDISRDPRWGRVAEGAGEDPWLGARIAEARVKGTQGGAQPDAEHVLACVKHFAAYGAPQGGRDYNVVDMSERELFETYLPPYEAAIKAGAGTVMTSFSEISGIPSTSNTWLLQDLLRERWNFKGFVVTDYTAINELVDHGVAKDTREAGRLAFNAGADMDTQGLVYSKHLKSLLATGEVKMATLNASVRRVLQAKLDLGLFKDPNRGVTEERAAQILFSAEHVAKARDVARRSIVLLKNDDGVLPLQRRSKIALIGPMAENKRDQIGNWSAAGDWKQAVSLREAMQAAAADFTFALGANPLDDKELIHFLNLNGGEIALDPRAPQALLDEALRNAHAADVIVLALGETQGMSGEAASRTKIRIPENQQALLRALKETGKPIVLVLFNGRPLALEMENELSSAILETWFLGSQAGPAIADVLFGDYNPSGKLTMSFPVNEGQIPIYYSKKKTGRPKSDQKTEKYKSRYLDAPNEALFPFGWGLSYTKFTYSDPRLDRATFGRSDTLDVRVTVTNSGTRSGEETAQLYVRDRVASVTRPIFQLRGFAKVNLKAGEKKELLFRLPPDAFKFYDAKMRWIAETGEFDILVGGNSVELKQTTATLQDSAKRY